MRGRLILAGALLSLMASLSHAAQGPDENAEGRIPLVARAADPEGGQIKGSWRQVEGPQVKIGNANGARFDKAANKWVFEAFFIPTEPGKYVFELTVTNEFGQEAKRLFVQEVRAAVPPPIADPGPDQKRKVGEKVLLSGIDSKANGNRTLVTFQWAIKLAPEGFTLPPAKLSGRQVDFIAQTAGKYVFELKVNDGERWSAPAEVEVVVTSTRPPVLDDPDPPGPIVLPTHPTIEPPKNRIRAKAAEVKSVRVGDTVVLDGSQSTADEKDNPNFMWEQSDDGKAPIVRALKPDLTKPYQAERHDLRNYPVVSFVPTAPGKYTFVLHIVAGDQKADSEPVVFDVLGDTDPVNPPGAKPPVAVVTIGKTSTTIGDEITLDGSKSTSPDNKPLNYMWMPVPGKPFPIIRGKNGPVVRVSAADGQPGDYYIKLAVSDGTQSGESALVKLTFTAGNKPPLIEGKRAYECNVGDSIVLEVKVTDPENDPFDIKWTCEEPKLNIPDELVHQPRFRFHPNRAGSYLFRVTATDNKGAASSLDVQVGVKDPGILKPTAVITGPAKAAAGEKVTVSGGKSFNPANKPLTYLWSETTDGGAKIKEPPPANKTLTDWTFKVTEPGRYSLALIVSDGVNDSEPAKWNIDVAGSTVPPVNRNKPTATINGPLKPVAAGADVQLSGEGSTGDVPLSYSWTQPPDGGPDLGLKPSEMRGAVLRFFPLKPGIYTLNLTVTDANGVASAPATYAVSVVAPTPVAPRAVATVVGKNPVAAGKAVRLSSEGSSDAGGQRLSYKWKQTAGAPIVLDRDDVPELSVIPQKPGAYEFQLVVNNGALDSTPALVVFNATAAAGPKAVIGEIAAPSVGDTITLDGTGSTSANGAQLEYSWRQLQGEPVKLPVGDDRKPKLDVTVPAEGQYLFELAVNDGNDWSEPAKLAFTAKARGKNAPPVVVIDKLSITVEAGTEAVIDASKSFDPDHGPRPLTFRWKRGGHDLNEEGPILKFTPQAAATLMFEVTAFDGKDSSQPVTVQVNVIEKGALPVAVAAATPNPAKKSIRGAAKNLIILDGSGSQPPEKADSFVYAWKQTGGDELGLKPEQLAKQRVGLYIYKAGAYKFELTVSSGDSTSKPAVVDLKVEDE